MSTEHNISLYKTNLVIVRQLNISRIERSIGYCGYDEHIYYQLQSKNDRKWLWNEM